MRRQLFIVAILGLTPPAALAARDEAVADISQRNPVEQLIAELGSDEYAVRRRAEERLLRLGLDVYDELKAAEDHPDLEIAERIRYIVQRMRIAWIHADDAPEVRLLLSQYSELSEDGREARIGDLAALDDGAGLTALCRIARFDLSPLVARRAALAVLGLKLSQAQRDAASAACLAELGTSDRAPANWIRLYLRELADPETAIAEWQTANAAELALLKQESPDTDLPAVYDLLNRHLDHCHELKLAEATTAALLAIVDMTDDSDDPVAAGDRLQTGLGWSIKWIIDNQQWQALAAIEDRYDAAIRESRRLLYTLAAAVSRKGQQERADSLAERAYAMPDGEDDDVDSDRVLVAKIVAELGRVDWAEREYRRVIEERPVLDERGLQARSDLATWLHDREDFAGAAEVLTELCDAAAADDVGRQQLIEAIEMTAISGRETLLNIEARKEFYLACVAEARKDYKEQLDRLEAAYKKYEKDPDILIAMYRSPGADEESKQRTASRIGRTAKFMQALIDEYDDVPSYYNQYAWLISNTEGNFQLAIEYSKKSLELAPDEPSYLDTLGRCYYAAGDYENAVKSQRKAVELAPQYGVMRRQLRLFEQALADQQRDAQGGTAAGTDAEK
jgi:tetratricopeptide (TPR) repeat protein